VLAVEVSFGAAGVSSALTVVDASTPHASRVVSSETLPGYTLGPSALAIQGNYAYVGQQSEGLLVFDVSNPALPRLVKTVPVTGWINYVASNEGLEALFVGTSGPGAGLKAFDLRNPADPIQIWAVGLSLIGLETEGDRVFLPQASGFTVVEIEQLSPLTGLNSLISVDPLLSDYSVAAHGNRVVWSGPGRLTILELSGVTYEVVQTIPTASWVTAMGEDDGYLFVTDQSSTLTIIQLDSAPN